MMRSVAFGLVFLLAVWIIPAAVEAQEIRQEPVVFEPGQLGASIDGAITGSQIVDYLLSVDAGQTMTVDLDKSNTSSYFNVMIGDDPEALHIGSVAGDHFERRLSAAGQYRIRVYLMPNAARRDEKAEYTLTVSFDSAPSQLNTVAAPSETGDADDSPPPDLAANPDFADGLTGGPDFWQVTGVPQGDLLNVRAGPGTENAILGRVRNGDTVQNLGCEMAGNSRWCQINHDGDRILAGWVNGRYLREASAPVDATAIERQSTGEIPCSPMAGQPTTKCAFRATRGDDGNASIWIALPSGGERYLEFAEGEPVGTDPGLEISHEKLGDLYLLRIDGVERYEIPEALVFGG